MASLRDIPFQIGYGPQDDRLKDFFIPALAASVRYDRAAGYFSSTMLAVAAAGVTKLILNGGKMRLLCGAELSEADVEAIRQGHAMLEERLAERMKMRLVLPESDYVENRLKVLAWLIGTGQLEIRVVLPTDAQGQPLARQQDGQLLPPQGRHFHRCRRQPGGLLGQRQRVGHGPGGQLRDVHGLQLLGDARPTWPTSATSSTGCGRRRRRTGSPCRSPRP